jgi:octaprenyl-diphosphate synthase
VQDALDLVRAQMMQIWQDAIALVRIQSGVAPRTGGKMLRPALCLLSAGAIGAKDVNRFASLAAAFEALHIASLAHDDVIDRALLRRGDRSLNGLWDNHAAVLGGDYLVARSVEIMATYDSCPVIANAIKSVRRMAEGELYFFGKQDAFTKEDCIHLAEQKTASLFAEACSAATYIVDHTYREVLHRFGTALGIAFQIVDDLLDVTQSTEQLGKPACGDLVEGKRTIPIMYMREALDAEGVRRLDAMRDAEISEEDREWAIAMAEETGARERTEADARAYADAALHELSKLPASPYRDSMEGIVEFVLIRGS